MTAAELILFPDVEAWLTAHLRDGLAARTEAYCADVHVGIDEPNPRPARSVVVRRVGGFRLDRVRELARMGVNVWAATEADAADLTSMVRALVAACPDGLPVVKAAEQSANDVPDAQPHRYVVVDLTVRGSAA